MAYEVRLNIEWLVIQPTVLRFDGRFDSIDPFDEYTYELDADETIDDLLPLIAAVGYWARINQDAATIGRCKAVLDGTAWTLDFGRLDELVARGFTYDQAVIQAATNREASAEVMRTTPTTWDFAYVMADEPDSSEDSPITTHTVDTTVK